MSIFDQVSSMLGSQGEGPGSNALLSGAMEMLSNHPGGVQGLASAFEQSGLGHLASSWIGNGENLPVSADQIKSVLGDERVSEFASKLGISPDTAAGHLAQLLPGLVDKLSPQGQVSAGEGGDLMSTGMGLLGGLFGKGTAA
jgi:uncharacterized protein YidB (DUF937 family)